MTQHRRALTVLAAASALDAVLGLAFAAADHVGVPDGLFFSLTTATTVGYGDITAHGWLPHLLTVAMMLLVIPLFAATFSLLTSGLTSTHVAASEDRMKAHFEERLREHLGGRE